MKRILVVLGILLISIVLIAIYVKEKNRETPIPEFRLVSAEKELVLDMFNPGSVSWEIDSFSYAIFSGRDTLSFLEGMYHKKIVLKPDSSIGLNLGLLSSFSRDKFQKKDSLTIEGRYYLKSTSSDTNSIQFQKRLLP